MNDGLYDTSVEVERQRSARRVGHAEFAREKGRVETRARLLDEVIAEVKRLPGAGGAQSLLWLEDVLALLRRMKEEPNA